MIQTTVAKNFLPQEFTLSELQRVLLTVGEDPRISNDSVFFTKAPKLPFIEKHWMKKENRRKQKEIRSGLPSSIHLMISKW